MIIHNRPTEKKTIHWKHYVIHGIHATIVFLLGVAADLAIVHHLHSRPIAVRWESGETQTNFIPSSVLPATNQPIQIGWTENGYPVWRPRQ